MVQKVIPMLPRLLCEELCSLNPNEDRLTFSVVWKMDGNGIVQDEWMGKGVIRSRVKLSYEHAQEMIDNPEKVWAEEEHPPIGSGATMADIVERVRNLHQIAVKLRRKRFEKGTLRLDKAKISFDLDGKTGMPIGWHPYVQRESNKLIEEYMLLANMAVAHRIYKAFPDRAMLRCHPKPDGRQLEELRALCHSLGINFSHESSKGIQETLNTFPANSPEHLVLSHLSMKPMKPAKYFCAATADGDPEEFVHYALSVPLYTHFTSPIRRYPDVIVHRLLAACLDVEPEPKFTSEDLDIIAGRCNDKKNAAKKAGEASGDLYLGAFVRECGPLTEDGIVVQVMHESVDVLVPDFGIIKRVYFKFCHEVKSFKFQEGHKTHPAEVLITWKSPQDKSKKDGERDGEKKGDGHRGEKTSKKEDSHHHHHEHRRTVNLKIFSRVRVLLKSENDKKKNKGGLKFAGELLQNVAKK
jgi:DIS3-like exonuclease 2